MDQSLATTFADRLSKLRALDDSATEQFVATYEPFIRRTVRFRIARASLGPAADSADVCQSVLAGFLLRLASGGYELHNEEDLRKLLVAIANKKFLRLKRREMAAKRCRARTQSLGDLPELASSSLSRPAPLNAAVLIKQLSHHLSAHEMQLFRLRSQGLDWNEISERLQDTPSILRKRLSRAIQRVTSELSVSEDRAGESS